MKRPSISLSIPELERRTASRDDRAKRLLHQCDVADRWRLSPRTLERWRHRRQGPRFIKIGGRVRYRIEDVEAYETSHLVERAAE